MKHSCLIVIAICSALMGCVDETVVKPITPVETRAEIHQEEIFAKAEENYNEDLKAREEARQEEQRDREHNMAYYKAQRVNVEACYAACQEENTHRKTGWDELQKIRENIRHTCKTTGTQFQGRSDLIETDENSPTAHPRIVEDNGKLVYLERRVDVVEVRPKWICPKDSDTDMLEVARAWMYETPPSLNQRPCSMIRGSVAMQGTALDVCLRWVHADGFK